ncbi:MAG: hypothetical protein WDM77_11650 [Steroidobacteraceae bacterium]
MTLLVATGLTLRRQGHTLLDQVSTQGQAGDFLAVIGAKRRQVDAAVAYSRALLNRMQGVCHWMA